MKTRSFWMFMDCVALKGRLLLRLVRAVDTLKLRLFGTLKLLMTVKVVLVLVLATTHFTAKLHHIWNNKAQRNILYNFWEKSDPPYSLLKQLNYCAVYVQLSKYVKHKRKKKQIIDENTILYTVIDNNFIKREKILRLLLRMIKRTLF